MKKISIGCLVLLIGVFAFVEYANAIRVTLKRIVFEGSKRTEVIMVINNSDVPETYRLGWREMVMSEDKSLKPLKEGDVPPASYQSAQNMIRYAPRRFTVPPKSSQQIRLMLRMPGNLPDGEYRSHLWIKPEEDVQDLKRGNSPENSGKGGVSVKMLAGVTMPVIVRKGNLSATAEVANLQASESTGFVTVNYSLLREGNRSLYGDVEFVCNAGAGEFILKEIHGIALYTEINQRNFKLRIEKEAGKPRCSTLTVRYTETDGFVGKKLDVLAQATTQVN